MGIIKPKSHFCHRTPQIRMISNKIRYQVILLIFLLAIIPILIIHIINIRVTSSLTYQKNQEILTANSHQTRDLLDAKLSSYKDVYFNISMNSSFMDNLLLLNNAQEDSMRYRRIKDALDTSIMSNILLYPEIQAVGVISNSNVPYFFAQKREANQSCSIFFKRNYLELNKTLGADSKIKSGMIDKNDPCFDPENPSFYIGGGCFHYEKMRIIGTMVVFINPSALNEVINKDDSPVYSYSDHILIDSNNNIVCDKFQNSGHSFSSVAKYNQFFSDINESLEMTSDNRYIASKTCTNYFNFSIVSIFDYGAMNDPLKHTWVIVALLTIFAIVFTLFILYQILGKIFIRPIELIANSISSIDIDNLNSPLPISSTYEIAAIETAYNTMLQRIRSLINENEAQLNEILQMNRRACEAELRSLEFQINPHFIFNTLDTINWMAVQGGALDVSEALNKLAIILRYTVYNINMIVPIKDDVEWTHKYLDLQKIRFHNHFSYDIYINEKILSLHIHKLLLEPILENSLIHGFDGVKQHGYIQVRYSILSTKYLEIVVSDNGKGIGAEKLKELRLLLRSNNRIDNKTANSIGIANVVYRMREYYPHSYIMISSAHDITCTKLFIPISELEKKESQTCQ